MHDLEHLFEFFFGSNIIWQEQHAANYSIFKVSNGSLEIRCVG